MSELNSAVTKSWGRRILGYLCLLIGFIQRKNKLFCIFVACDNFTAWSKKLSKVRFIPSQGNWEIGALSSSVITFQKDGSLVLEKDIPGKKLLKRFIYQM